MKFNGSQWQKLMFLTWDSEIWNQLIETSIPRFDDRWFNKSFYKHAWINLYQTSADFNHPNQSPIIFMIDGFTAVFPKKSLGPKCPKVSARPKSPSSMLTIRTRGHSHHKRHSTILAPSNFSIWNGVDSVVFIWHFVCCWKKGHIFTIEGIWRLKKIVVSFIGKNQTSPPPFSEFRVPRRIKISLSWFHFNSFHDFLHIPSPSWGFVESLSVLSLV